MSETPTPHDTAPVPVSAFARITDVIASPGKAFASIAKQPTWFIPALVFMVLMVVSIAYFNSKADWVAIDTATIEGMIGKIVPAEALDEAIKQSTALLRRFSTGQLMIFKTLERTAGIPLFLYGMALVYATLFVFMGAFPGLKLGSAWLGFLLSLLVFIGYLCVNFIATKAYGEAPGSLILLTTSGAIAATIGWFWLMERQAKKDPEFHRVLAVCSHAMMISALGGLVLIASVAVAAPPLTVAPENFVKSNLGAFITVSSPALKSLLGSLDLFTLWLMVVLTIGFRAITRLSFGLAASITWLPWAVITMVKIAFRAIFS